MARTHVLQGSMKPVTPHTGQDLIDLSNNPSLPTIEEPKAIIDPGDRHGFGMNEPRLVGRLPSEASDHRGEHDAPVAFISLNLGNCAALCDLDAADFLLSRQAGEVRRRRRHSK
jgi:hypothetical protein